MRSIVVPVDGSALAEFALMPAAELARRHGARLWLAVVHDLVVATARGRGVLTRALRRDLALRLAHALGCPALLNPQRADQTPVLRPASTSGVTMRHPKAAESASIDREHLTRVLLEQMERAYGSEGTAGLSRMLGELLRRLDDRALRDCALALGLTSELEIEDESERDGPRREGLA